MGAALIGAGLAVVYALTGRQVGRRSRPSALYGVVALGGQLYAGACSASSSRPNEQVREAPYIQYNIEATRRAFALDRIVQRPLTGDAELTRADIDRNRATLDNVRLWDHQPLLETFGQIQEIRTYYDFIAVDNDRYEIDGQLRQVMLSARELNPAALPNRTWVNERLTFTHGHGLTLGPVNQVTGEGLPVLFIRDLPPVSTVEPAGHRAEPLLRRAVERVRDRPDQGPRVPLPQGRRQRLLHLRGHRRHRPRLAVEEAGLRRALPQLPAAALRRHHAREPAAVRSPDRPAGAEDRPVPHLRRRPLPGRRTTGACSGCSTPTR